MESATYRPLEHGLMADAITGLLTRWYPLQTWLAFLMSGVATPDEFYYICYDCWPDVQFNTQVIHTGYNTVVGAVDYNAKANKTVKFGEVGQPYMDDASMTAQEVAEAIFESWCVKGVMVVKRYVGEVMRTTDFHTF